MRTKMRTAPTGQKAIYINSHRVTVPRATAARAEMAGTVEAKTETKTAFRWPIDPNHPTGAKTAPVDAVMTQVATCAEGAAEEPKEVEATADGNDQNLIPGAERVAKQKTQQAAQRTA